MGVKHIFRHFSVFNFVGCMIHSFLVFDSVVIFLEVGSVRNISFHRKQKKAPRNLSTGNTKERQEIPYFMNQEIPYFINQIIPRKAQHYKICCECIVGNFKLLVASSYYLSFLGIRWRLYILHSIQCSGSAAISFLKRHDYLICLFRS